MGETQRCLSVGLIGWGTRSFYSATASSYDVAIGEDIHLLTEAVQRTQTNVGLQPHVAVITVPLYIAVIIVPAHIYVVSVTSHVDVIAVP